MHLFNSWKWLGIQYAVLLRHFLIVSLFLEVLQEKILGRNHWFKSVRCNIIAGSSLFKSWWIFIILGTLVIRTNFVRVYLIFYVFLLVLLLSHGLSQLFNLTLQFRPRIFDNTSGRIIWTETVSIRALRYLCLSFGILRLFNLVSYH